MIVQRGSMRSIVPHVLPLLIVTCVPHSLIFPVRCTGFYFLTFYAPFCSKAPYLLPMRHQRKLSIHCRVIAGVLSVLLQGVALAQTVDPGLQFRTDQERQQAEQQQLLNRPDVRLPTGPVASDERLLADEAPCFMGYPYSAIERP